MARTKKTRKGANLAAFIDKVLTRGVDIEKLLADPVALASMSGVKLTRPQKAQLLKLPLAETLDQLYTGLGGVDKRFLMGKRKGGPGRAAASIPPTMIIPVVGVVIAVAVVATVIASVPGAKVVDNSPRAKDKL